MKKCSTHTPPPATDRCHNCAQPVAGHESVHCGSLETRYRLLCWQCFNTEVAALGGLDKFEHVQFEPVRLRWTPARLPFPLVPLLADSSPSSRLAAARAGEVHSIARRCGYAVPASGLPTIRQEPARRSFYRESVSPSSGWSAVREGVTRAGWEDEVPDAKVR
jgi:hypothetical protein